MLPYPNFWVGVGDPNSGSHVYAASFSSLSHLPRVPRTRVYWALTVCQILTLPLTLTVDNILRSGLFYSYFTDRKTEALEHFIAVGWAWSHMIYSLIPVFDDVGGRKVSRH